MQISHGLCSDGLESTAQDAVLSLSLVPALLCYFTPLLPALDHLVHVLMAEFTQTVDFVQPEAQAVFVLIVEPAIFGDGFNAGWSCHLALCIHRP